MWAARKGHVGVIKALLDKQADINKPGNVSDELEVCFDVCGHRYSFR